MNGWCGDEMCLEGDVIGELLWAESGCEWMEWDGILRKVKRNKECLHCNCITWAQRVQGRAGDGIVVVRTASPGWLAHPPATTSTNTPRTHRS